MNLFTDPIESLSIDKNTGSIFGEQEQLEVLGWSHKRDYNKIYVVKCSICKEDPELFGNGLFSTTMSNLKMGRIPCGCAKTIKWNKLQYKVLCLRVCKSLPQDFIDFSEPWLGNETKLILTCSMHGQWNTTTIASLLAQKVGCPICSNIAVGNRFRLPDEELIKDIRNSGVFSEYDLFVRSEKLDRYGYKAYFKVYCNTCGETYDSLISSLRLGQKGCLCKGQNQKYTYVTLIYDEDLPVALKFGITSNYSLRHYHQSTHSSYGLYPYSLWEYPNKFLARDAEKECLEKLDCGALTKREFSDGYTETTSVKNLDEISKIYRKHGGVNITQEFCENMVNQDLVKIKAKLHKLIAKLDENSLEIKSKLMYIVGMVNDTKTEGV